jgi:phenylacetate-CoA ligase
MSGPRGVRAYHSSSGDWHADHHPLHPAGLTDWAIMFAGATRWGVTNLTACTSARLTASGRRVSLPGRAELLGAFVIPDGAGNTDKRIQLMMDMKCTVLTATSSYALLLAEEIESAASRANPPQARAHRLGALGREDARRIADELGVSSTHLRPHRDLRSGIAISCDYECDALLGHYVYFESSISAR